MSEEMEQEFERIDADAPRIGVIGSPSETSGVKVDILGHSVDRRLVGSLTYFTFEQEGRRHCALGQITEITLKNPWVEDATMRSLIREKGQVDPITERQDTHTATMEVGAVFAEGGERYQQGELGTIPPTGTRVKEVGNELLDHLLSGQPETIHKIGQIYGTETHFPAWFRHFGSGPDGADEAYHLGIFGKTGSGKSVLSEILLLGYASHDEMSIFVLDPQGQFYRDFSEGSEVRSFVEGEIGKEVITVNARDIQLTDSSRYPLFLKLLGKTRFFDEYGVYHPDNQEKAKAEIGKLLRGETGTLNDFQQDAPPPWEVHEREHFDRVWAGLGREDIQKSIYTSDNPLSRIQGKHETLDPDSMYTVWRRVAKLFTKEGRWDAGKIEELTEEVVSGDEGKLIVIDLSEENAPPETLWNEEIKLTIIGEILEDLTAKAEHAYREEEKLNTLVLLDEAHRFAPREDPEEDRELANLKELLVDSVRTTRKYGLGWGFISQTIRSLDPELVMQLRIYIVGYGLAWGLEWRTLRDLVGGERLKLYRSFRDPEASLGDADYPFMAVGPLSPLSFSGAPLYFTALEWPDEVLEVYRSNMEEDYGSNER